MKNHGEFNSATGDKGELWFASVLPHGWIWQPPRKDLGKDGIVVIRDGSEQHNFEFGIQVKTTLKSKNTVNNIKLSGISRSSILYWHMSSYPTLVVAVDSSSDRTTAWYAWHFDLFQITEGYFDPKGSKTLGANLPAGNRLDENGWSQIRSDLTMCYSHLYRSMRNSKAYFHLSACVSLLATIAKTLLHARDPEGASDNNTIDASNWLLLEEYQHIKALAIFDKLIKATQDNAGYSQELFALRTEYSKRACSVFPEASIPIDNLADVPPRKDFVCVSSLLNSNRTPLILLILDAIELLTRFEKYDNKQYLK